MACLASPWCVTRLFWGQRDDLALTAHTVPTDDLGSVPKTHVCLQQPVIPVPGNLIPSATGHECDS